MYQPTNLPTIHITHQPSIQPIYLPTYQTSNQPNNQHQPINSFLSLERENIVHFIKPKHNRFWEISCKVRMKLIWASMEN